MGLSHQDPKDNGDNKMGHVVTCVFITINNFNLQGMIESSPDGGSSRKRMKSPSTQTMVQVCADLYLQFED